MDLANFLRARMSAVPDELHLLGFEKRLVTKSQAVQLERLTAESPGTPDDNERNALARGLIGCASAWVLVGIPLVVLALALQLTVGVWALIGWVGVVACIGMNRWRVSQSKGITAGIER